jgi:beta-glucosidase-like glycosyl hydrolase
VDFSFAPVLDLDYATSSVIGDRAFHSNPDVVVKLAGSLIKGMHDAGMKCVGKHFPGHGFVAADSHLDLPVDERPLKITPPMLGLPNWVFSFSDNVKPDTSIIIVPKFIF